MILYNPIYTLKEACELLKITETILWSYIKIGRLKYVIIEDTCFMYRAKKLSSKKNLFSGKFIIFKSIYIAP
jgi:predicted site-specific integrase-resolvase